MPLEAQNLVKKVEYKLRNISVSNFKQQAAKGGVIINKDTESFINEKLTVKIINKLNKCVVHMCKGDLNLAR